MPGGRPRPSQEGCTLATATATKTKLRPLGDRVVIKPSAKEEMTKSGIVLPDTAKEKPQEGKVVAVGNGKMNDEGQRIPMDVQEGDRILFGKYSGSEVNVEDDEYVIMREDDVLAILGKDR